MAEGGVTRTPAELDPRFLYAEELRYELGIRGVPLAGTAGLDGLTNLLRRHQRRDIQMTEVAKLDCQQEERVLSRQTMELHTLHREAKLLGRLRPDSSRLTTLLVHGILRLRRILFLSDGEVFTRLLKIASRQKEWHRTLSQEYRHLEFPLVTIPEEEDEHLLEATRELSINEQARNPDQDSERREERGSCSRRTEPEVARQRVSRSRGGSRQAGSTEAISPSTEEIEDESDRLSHRRKKTKKTKKSKRKKKRHAEKGGRRSSSETTDSSSTDSSNSSEEPRVKSRKNPVTSWKVKFSGGEDVAQFLEDLEELAAAHSVQEKDLLRGVRSLLSGSALSWFRASKDRICSWQAFKNLIRKAFAPGDCDDVILDRLRKMRQREEETFVVYSARMDDLFRKLDEPLSERQKVKMLMKGLHLFYSSRICEEDIKSESQLRRACQKWEASKTSILRKEKERNNERDRKNEKSSHEEKRRVESGRRHYEVSKIDEPLVKEETPDLSQMEVSAMTTGPRRAVQCWRCGRFGHFSTQCTEKISCLSCGQTGTIVENCSRCAQAKARGLWQPPQQPLQQQQPQPSTCQLQPQELQTQVDFLNGAWNGMGSQAPVQHSAPPLDLFQPPFHLPPPLIPQVWNPQQPRLFRPQRQPQQQQPPQQQQHPQQQRFQPRATLSANAHQNPAHTGDLQQ